MNEAETRADLIDPAIKMAGWGVVEASRVRREAITLGRLQGAGSRAKQDIADYVLEYKNQKLAVIEAKRADAAVTEGLAQAKRYAEKLQSRFAYSTNGVGIYCVDMHTGAEGPVDGYPSPQELWEATYAEQQATERYWRDRISSVPFEDSGGQWQPRYYQHNAINKALDAITEGRDRILLTLATGTGKTAIAFQIAWKLYQSRWNIADWRKGIPEGEPGKRPRILFLADRNILADQAYNAFGAFQEDALVRIEPDVIRKKGRVPKNGSVFFTIFQTFMAGRDEQGNPKPSFGDYPPDFFDFIVIDECHRGGAHDEGTWRGILEYFAPAVQLGLTATPKRDANADTYAYFGEPVYIYSLKEGINDGFLTPFKVKQIATTLDDYIYTPDDDVIAGEVETGKRYTESDFNRIIEIKAREQRRVKIFMGDMDQRQKTLVFCANQAHALTVRDLINQNKTSTHPDYCVRVTANDGKEGERQLRVFQDNEKTIPTILTTSQKLSTGVDARNVRNIILMRPVNSMIEFKQIIGRGTRLYDGKDYFTVYDFVRAYEHFSDPEWDGEPIEPEPSTPRPPRPDTEPPLGEPPIIVDPPPRVQKVVIKLADGKERLIQHMVATTFWSPDGTPMSAAQFVERLYGELPTFFNDEDQLREIWSKPDTREALLQELSERGFGKEQLAEITHIIAAEDSDIYDVLAYIAFATSTLTRDERARRQKPIINSQYNDKQREFIDFVLAQYVGEGVGELAISKLPDLIELKYHGIQDAVEVLGSVQNIREVFIGFQERLYLPTTDVDN
ncbi:DEAD/DEAH box helicase family protein [Haliea sp. E1-2-M8]|uniref:EcoAI/FtnUII family type I restriction enzme subunit R n=1 Tax=Haliea sp. E1-2-M8 TaxID=3064706 RepID=UPI002727C182|nr:type I restriction endonuclease subunit R [Haliea sp. E1-2-M8]MDO8863723.1 DEAD/DEAH box helicase family protein [Haliea sp. E1-2-M8]